MQGKGCIYKAIFLSVTSATSAASLNGMSASKGVSVK